MTNPNTENGHERILQLDTYWPYQLTVLADRISRRTARVVKEDAGLNLSQWRVLAAIAEVPGRTSVDVVTITPMDKGIVSRATKALLDMKLVVRKASQDDGRVSHLFLTPKGQALYQTLIPRVEAVLERADEALNREDQAVLKAHLRRLMHVIPDQR